MKVEHLKLIQDLANRKVVQDFSIDKAIEELGELIVALAQSKTKSNKPKVEHYKAVLEEVADVTIQLESIKALFTITPEMMELAVDAKIEKMKGRL